MSPETLKRRIVDAIQKACGYTQPNVGEVVMEVVEPYLDKTALAAEDSP